MTKDNATPRPWRMTQTSMPSQLLLQGGELKDGNSFSIQMSKENAGLIVKAVNCHDELVQALKEADAVLTNQDGRVKEIIKQALSKAESEPIK